MLLEERLTPLAVAWIYKNSTEDLSLARKLETIIAMHLAKTFFYLVDVVNTAARMREPTAPVYTLPAPSDNLAVLTEIEFNGVVAHVMGRAFSKDAISLYVFACRLRHPPLVEEIRGDVADLDVMTKIIMGVAAESKFKYTNDLFIHCIIKLKLPAWIVAGLCQNETPYRLAGRVFGTETNNLIRPLVQSDVGVLLASLPPHERFCIQAALILEVGNDQPPCIAINTEVTLAAPDVPTLAVVGGIWEFMDDIAFGYVHRGVFHTSTNPMAVLAAWSIACDPASHISVAVSGAPLFDNPLRKYL